eukprot:TRINITY_DN155_c0_g1_i1.p1 TRINITY_DN155_c0_g1~~TRINITY_DN155_c0_g1_i1.p1  ORF type:complete len:194 (+),score=19.08 TRINITY_DN155_c0_g1_i1:263-844(+)
MLALALSPRLRLTSGPAPELGAIRLPIQKWPHSLAANGKMAIVLQPEEFQHILRILNTNVDGRRTVPYSLTAIRGCGRRFAHLICKKADIDVKRRAGTLSAEEINRLVAVMQNPTQFKIPEFLLNRQKDIKDGKFKQLLSNLYDQQLRDDLNRLGKMRCQRGLRHSWGLRVRGQHTKTSGRRGRTVGVSKKKG